VKRPVDLDYIRFVSNMQVKGLDATDKFDDMTIEKMPDGSSHPFFFQGQGSLQFKEVSDDWGTGSMKGCSNGAAYADLNNDGNLDMVINCLNAPAIVLKNNSPAKNQIAISFRGDSLNTAGIGAKAYVFTKGKLQYQQLMLTRGFQSSCDARLHFGLDSAAVVDSVIVVWPDQSFQRLVNVPVNKPLAIQKKDAAGTFSRQSLFPPPVAMITEMPNELLPKWRHIENDFLDYNVQYLIPHAQSDRGPKVAVADVNGDKLEDMYVCGSFGHGGRLMLQQPGGNFITADSTVLGARAVGAYEDVDAIFFDANGDSFPDLYIVSGGNELTGNSEYLEDRLYLNDGKGRFTHTVLPSLRKNKSCVSVADIDKDGDNDLFVGVLADATAYGVPQTSALLINDGKANFTIANDQVIPLTKLGLVTSSAFADINGDGWSDLVVAGEWMPLTVFVNDKGKFRSTPIASSTGLWQTIMLDDMNGDGHIDILAGNWGWNNKFWAGKNGPVRMYVADFDKNGKTEQLVSYTLNGVEYPFLAKDEVERPLPLLKKHYLYYSEYAGVPMKDVFYGWIDTIQPVMAERLGSAIAYGDGKGGFTLQDLPEQLQLAPILSFQKIGNEQGAAHWLAGGNFFNVIPYEGRYDAQPLAMFSIGNRRDVKYVHQPNLAALSGQVRDIKWINTKDGRILVVARNNDPLKLYVVNR
jgi:enediyne biosynthesis protein E4